MSDEQDNNDGLPNNETMQAEWSRVMSNPDNLIVSDVLRSALPVLTLTFSKTKRLLLKTSESNTDPLTSCAPLLSLTAKAVVFFLCVGKCVTWPSVTSGMFSFV